MDELRETQDKKAICTEKKCVSVRLTFEDGFVLEVNNQAIARRVADLLAKEAQDEINNLLNE